MATQKKEVIEMMNGRECKVLTFASGKAYFYSKFKARESRLANALVYKSISGSAEEMASGQIQINLGTVLANFEGLLDVFCVRVEDNTGTEVPKVGVVGFFDSLETNEGSEVQAVLLDSLVTCLSTGVLEVQGGRAKKA